ncbi:MAG: pyridoxal-phosphate dependent enzyme [Candidatus Methanomethyliaceae archaeon]|nr:pyridoxal-phosphate dependent enzyme [Candidatus Methanomethyliaceae archaeon]
MSFRLLCKVCGKNYSLKTNHWRCVSCNRPLNLVTELPRCDQFDQLVEKNERGIWRYKRLIPFSEESVSLGEGNTPVVEMKDEGAKLKLEYFSPTGSFKDRGAAVSVSRAKCIGVRSIVEDSSGNAGIAAAAYAARASIRARIYVPKDAPLAKRVMIRACGADVVECESRKDASARAVGELKENELYIGHTWDPFYIEGMKTVAFELFESKCIPDAVMIPVASGTLFLGLFKGFLELNELGFLDKIPKFYAVQGESCAPLYEAMYGPIRAIRGSALADGLRIDAPPRKEEILNAIRKTSGEVLTVNDDEIIGALKDLYKKGIIVEPTSATAYAAFKRGKDLKNENVLIPMTGTGIKTVDKISKLFIF